MADGQIQNNERTGEERQDFVEQRLPDGTAVTITRGYNAQGEVDYYFLDVAHQGGGHYQREISTADMQAWREVDAMRPIIRNAFTRQEEWSFEFWFINHTRYDAVEFTRDEAQFIADALSRPEYRVDERAPPIPADAPRAGPLPPSQRSGGREGRE